MKQWFEGLLPREQRMVAGGSVVVVLTLLYMLIWEPLTTGKAELREDIAYKTTLLEQGRRALATQPTFSDDLRVDSTPTQSLTLLVENTVSANNLLNAYRNSSPSANDGIRVSLENASFDAMISWLGQLGNANNVVVTAGSISDRRETGRVDASIVLERR
ncbi:MAG: type II secretion system protein GspM [Pseudomonadota bacterium]